MKTKEDSVGYLFERLALRFARCLDRRNVLIYNLSPTTLEPRLSNRRLVIAYKQRGIPGFISTVGHFFYFFFYFEYSFSIFQIPVRRMEEDYHRSEWLVLFDVSLIPHGETRLR